MGRMVFTGEQREEATRLLDQVSLNKDLSKVIKKVRKRRTRFGFRKTDKEIDQGILDILVIKI